MSHLSKPWAVAVLVWIGFIFFTSTNLAQQLAEKAFNFFTGQLSKPHPEHGWEYMVVDKGFHVAIFCIFAVLLSQAILLASRKALVVIASGAFVGSCSEYLQSFFPGRDPAVRDVLINIGGTILGYLMHSSLFSRFSLKRMPVPAASTDL